MKIALIKRNSQLQPMYNSDMEAFNKLKNNTIYTVDIKQPRNIKFLKKYWALCKLVFENSENFSNKECVSDYLKYKSGNFEHFFIGNSEVCVKPKSIAFENMTGEEWDVFYNSIVPHICKELDCTEHEIAENIIFEM